MKNLKKILFSFLVLLFVSSCSNRTEDMQDETVVVGETNYLYKGNFVSQSHPTSGTAKVITDKSKLNFETFKSDSGPDLNIYLAANLSNIKSDFIDLGDIKGLDGNYSYALPANVDFSKYKYVVVWCVDFNVNFGYATLAP